MLNSSKILQNLLILGILAFGAFFRFISINWDSGYMLHPDERFLVMLTEALKLPSSFTEYLNPMVSQMNPENVGYGFYVYGILPVFMAKIMGYITGMDVYNDLAILGRLLAAAVDTLVIVIVYKMAHLIQQYRKWPKATKYWAAFVYAISVLPIQLAHFYTVDPFLNFFVAASLFFMLKFYFRRRILAVVLSGVFISAGLASKISAVYATPLLVALFLSAYRSEIVEFSCILVRMVRKILTKKEIWSQVFIMRKVVLKIIFTAFVFAGVSYLALRLFNPYYFESSSFTDLQLSEKWLANIEQLKSFEGDEVWFPPAIQWISKPPVTFALWNMAVFGLGMPLFLLVIVGLILFICDSLGICRKVGFNRAKSPEMLFITVWILLFFFYQSTQFVKALRYFIMLYPLFAIAAGFALATITAFSTTKDRRLNWIVPTVLLILVLVWPLMFLNIYIQPHSRVQASTWIHANMPDGYVLSEHWDDSIPLRIPNSQKQFLGEQMEVFGADTDDKFIKMFEQMRRADYFILSSNRGWGSMPTVPKMYPRMGWFYDSLFAEKLGYKQVRTFTVYPSLEYLGISLTLQDDLADETFTVYDHPKVIIMQNIDPWILPSLPPNK